MSQSQSQSQKRGMADFFKPYTKSEPAKRPSPVPESNTGNNDSRSPKKPKKAPKTPATATRFVDLASSPFRSPFASGQSPNLPIRSPRPREHDPPSSLRSNLFSSPPRRPSSPVKAPTPFSFTDIARSGQSVVKDGKVVAIRDSDDDDSESLESLEDIFGGSNGGHASSSSPPEDELKKENKRPSILGVFSNRERKAIVGKERLRGILSKERMHKFDISKLIDDHLDDEETKVKLDQASAYYEASARQAEVDTKHSADDRKLLRDIIDGKGGDQDEVARVLSAMERTGALTFERCFSFFGRGGFMDWREETPPKHNFPKEDLPQNLWNLRDSEYRLRSYLCGELDEMAKNGQLPDSLLQWTFESIALERDNDLREAYIRFLAAASKQWTRTNLNPQNIQDVFTTLGANSDATRDGVDIELNRIHISPEQRHASRYLLSVLEVFDVVAEDLGFEALSKLSSILIRLSLDDKAMDDGEIRVAVENLLSRLLELPHLQSRLHVAERILLDLVQSLKNSYLQARVLVHILPSSPLATRLRLVLAQAFLLPDYLPSLDMSEPPKISLPDLLQYLRSQTFDLAHRPNDNPVDYTELSASTHLLDIAISNGGLPSSFPTLAEEKAFNRQVDELADRVNVIFSSIADTGASHMRRTEAKEALGVLQKRLLYSVRTRPRPKKSVFGGRDGKEYRSEERSRGAMQSYLMIKETVVLKERDENAVPSSQRSETEKLIRKQLGLSQ